MKKFSWSKHLLLAGSIMVVAFACQKKPDDCSSSHTNQSAPADSSKDDACVDSEEDETCGLSDSSSEEGASSAQKEPEVAPAAAPVAERVVPTQQEAEAVTAPSPERAAVGENSMEAQRERSEAQEPRLEAVSPVSDLASDSSQE